MATMNKEVESEGSDNMPATGGTTAPFENFGWGGDEDVSFEEAPAPASKTKDEKVIEKIKEGVDDIDFSGKGKEKPAKAKDPKEDPDEDEDLDSAFADWEEEEDAPEVKDKKTTKKTKEVGSSTEDPEEGDDSDEDRKQGDQFYKTLSTELKEKGVFSNVEIDEDEDIDEERFFELQEEEVEARAEDLVKGVIADLKSDPEAAALLKHVRAGGTAKEFLATYKGLASNIFPEDFDVSDKKNATKLLKYAYSTFEEMDSEEIEDKLDWLEEKGKTTDTAEKYHKRIVKADEAKKKQLLDNQLAAREKSKNDTEKLRTSLLDVLKADKVGSFPFSAKEKKELPDLITKATVKVGEGKYITEFQSKMAEVIKTPSKLVILLKLLNNGFDTSDLVTEVNTEVTKRAKSRLADSKKNEKEFSGNKGVKSRSLADAFDE